MKKLSEVLRIYEKGTSFDEIEQYYSEKDIYKKIDDIKMLMQILGDVEFEEDALKLEEFKDEYG